MGDVVRHPREYLDVYCNEPLASENSFRTAPPDRSAPPTLAEVRHLLPQPFIDAPVSTPRALAEAGIAAYDKVWEIAFKNLNRARGHNDFAGPFLDSAFNDCLFMWDSVFGLLFARYARRGFDFQRTLDTFYRKQHADGFISREIHESNGHDQFHRADLPSTGPNVLAWSEWESFQLTGDVERLRRVFPALAAFHKWLAKHRTHADGSYFACGLASGMDNQPRTLAGDSAWCDHSFTSWIDSCAQAALSARLLVRMAEALGEAGEGGARAGLVRELRAELAALESYINSRMWCERRQFYFDRRLRGATGLSDVMTVGAYWTLLSGVVPRERLAPFVAHLDDPRTFNRPTRVPSLAADHEAYSATGGYWLGSSWPSTTFMVLKGLTAVGAGDTAADVALNYWQQTTRVFMQTGTLWENLAPERAAPGDPAKPDFVGWGGLAPVAVLIEYVFGLRADVPRRTLVWDLRTLDGFGVQRLPFGADGVVDVRVLPRAAPGEAPRVVCTSSVPLAIELTFGRLAEARGGVAVDRAAAPPLQTRRIELRAGVELNEGGAAGAGAGAGPGAGVLSEESLSRALASVMASFAAGAPAAPKSPRN
jgi:hypothetical protein